LLELALPAKAQHVIFEVQLDVLTVHPRQFSLDDNFAFGLENVHRRTPTRGCRRLVGPPGSPGIVKKPIHSILQHTQVTNMMPPRLISSLTRLLISLYPRRAASRLSLFFAKAGGSRMIVSYCRPFLCRSRRKSKALASMHSTFLRPLRSAFDRASSTASAEMS